MRVVFASGGTGGHIYPAIAIADRMRSRFDSFEPLFVGTRAGLESQLLGEYRERLKFVLSGPMRGRRFWGRIGTAAGLIAGVFQAAAILFRFKPDLIIGFGGYASASVVIAGFLMGKAVVLQEQNSVPGLANRLLSNLSRRVYLGFEHAGSFFSERSGAVYTGNPLRPIITEEYEGDPYSPFGLLPSIPTLLVFGGSQGASSLNRAATEFFRSGGDIQGIIQTGRRDYRKIKSSLSSMQERVFVAEYIENIREAYEAADIVLARAGALSVSEIAAVGKPSILVPYPFAADDHQSINARYLEEGGGAVTVKDADLNGELLGNLLGELFGDIEDLKKMAAAARKLGSADAADRIIDDIANISDGGKE